MTSKLIGIGKETINRNKMCISKVVLFNLDLTWENEAL